MPEPQAGGVFVIVEVVAEDEAAYESSVETMMSVPHELVPEVRELIARRKKRA